MFSKTQIEKQVLAYAMHTERHRLDILEQVRQDDFDSEFHRQIFDKIGAMQVSGEPVDAVTVSLTFPGKEIEVSAIYDNLNMGTPSPYVKQLLELSRRQKVKQVIDTAAEDLGDPEREITGIIEETTGALIEIETRGAAGYTTAREAVQQHLDYLSRLQSGETAILSGIGPVDLITGGNRPQDFVVVGARPSVGKTAFALTLARNMAGSGVPVGLISLEMSIPQLMNRLVSREAHIPHRSIRSGKLTSWDLKEYEAAADRLSALPLSIDDGTAATIPRLRSTARQMVRQQGVKALFIDYIGLVRAVDRKVSRFDHIGEVSRACKAIARELDIVVFGLSQLNRLAEGSRPSLAHLRESGSLEQDADQVIFLHCDRENYSAAGTVKTEIIIAKNRNGSTGNIEVNFHPEYQFFDGGTI